MVVPNNQGFPTKNDHFGVFWGYHHLRKPPNAKAFFQTFKETHIFVSLGCKNYKRANWQSVNQLLQMIESIGLFLICQTKQSESYVCHPCIFLRIFV